jgi:serine protease Do/serine protease DegQ
MNKSAYRAALAAVALAMLIPLAAVAEPPPPTMNGQPTPSLAPMIKRVTKSVVNISTRGKEKVQQRSPFMNDPFFRHFFGRPGPRERHFHALGSGVVVNADKGYVLTNNHVIEHADKITVILNDGRHFDAKVVGKDALTDLAVVQIKAKNLHQITLGDSSKLAVGNFVVAIGNPFGLSHTATFGIVSGLGRAPNTGRAANAPYENFIQTDASINPGNSGGALVNLNGQLVGINSMIFSKSGGNIGIGFAIPVNMAKNVMHQLIKYGKIKRGHLGVLIQTLTPKLADKFNVKNGHGAVVSQVSDGSPADKAGIEQGDVIVAVNGKPIKSSDQLRNMIGLTRPGTKVAIKLVRDGKTKTVHATLSSTSAASESGGSIAGKLGARLSDIKPDSPLYGKVQGVLVEAVKPGGEAAEAHITSGDVITAVNRHPVKNLAQFKNALSQYKGTLLLTVRTQHGVFFTTIR